MKKRMLRNVEYYQIYIKKTLSFYILSLSRYVVTELEAYFIKDKYIYLYMLNRIESLREREILEG